MDRADDDLSAPTVEIALSSSSAASSAYIRVMPQSSIWHALAGDTTIGSSWPNPVDAMLINDHLHACAYRRI
jgi:hypothetical protein